MPSSAAISAGVRPSFQRSDITLRRHARDHVFHSPREVVADRGLGPALVRLYGAGLRTKAEIYELHRAGEAELHLSTDADIEQIASAMISLGATPQDVLGAMADDESAMPGMRRAATEAAPAAEIVWSNYVRDSGGW